MSTSYAFINIYRFARCTLRIWAAVLDSLWWRRGLCQKKRLCSVQAEESAGAFCKPLMPVQYCHSIVPISFKWPESCPAAAQGRRGQSIAGMKDGHSLSSPKGGSCWPSFGGQPGAPRSTY